MWWYNWEQRNTKWKMSCSSQINYWVRNFTTFCLQKLHGILCWKTFTPVLQFLGILESSAKETMYKVLCRNMQSISQSACKWLTVHICIFHFVFFFQKVPLSQHKTVHIFETKNTGLLHAVNLHSAYVLTHFVAQEAIICDACVHCTSFKASFGWIDEFKSTQKSKRFFWKELINESLILITSMTSHQISRLYYKKVERIAKLDNWFHGIELLVHHTQMTNGKLIDLVINIFQTCWLPMHYAHYSPWH